MSYLQSVFGRPGPASLGQQLPDGPACWSPGHRPHYRHRSKNCTGCSGPLQFYFGGPGSFFLHQSLIVEHVTEALCQDVGPRAVIYSKDVKKEGPPTVVFLAVGVDLGNDPALQRPMQLDRGPGPLLVDPIKRDDGPMKRDISPGDARG